MLRTTHIRILLCRAAISVAASKVVATGASRSQDPTINITNIKVNVMPFTSGGIVIGKAADFISNYSNDVSDKALYGVGVSVAFYPVPNLGFALNLQRGFKTLSFGDGVSARGWYYSVSLLGNFWSQRRSTGIARYDLGFVTGKYTDFYDKEDLILGAHPYVRAGLGVFSILSHRLNMRVELFYMIAYSEGHRIEQLYNLRIPFNASSLGVEFAFGIPLLKR